MDLNETKTCHLPSQPAGPHSLKILYGYPYFPSEAYGDVEKLSLDYLARLREAGFEVEGFCLTLNPPGPCLTFSEMDALWRRGDRSLLGFYERLEAKLQGRDVLFNAPGINLHPEFVQRLPVFTVFQCFDDPENSHNLSRPVAQAYDLCMVGNAAELDAYRSWGARNVEWGPMGVMPEIYDRTLTEEEILTGQRDIDLFLMADLTSPWRRERLEKLGRAFPDAHFYGRGWPRGFLPPDRQLAYLRRAKLGPNLHNSTGPINYRTFYLPANGVMQICDNKSHLGTIYEVGKEAVGFENVDECIDLCRYYLAHDEERRQIAAAGWRRAITNYTEVPIFRRLVGLVEKYRPSAGARKTEQRGLLKPPAEIHASPPAQEQAVYRKAFVKIHRIRKRIGAQLGRSIRRSNPPPAHKTEAPAGAHCDYTHLRARVFTANNLRELQKAFGWKLDPVLDRPDIYDFDYIEDLNERRIRDAESLGLVMKNAKPKVALEIGTANGMATVLMAANAPGAQIYTVNILPEDVEAGKGGKLTTVAMTRDVIGIEFRKRGIRNITQIYANTACWEPDIGTIDVCFVDGCHDTEFVYNDTKKVLRQMKPGSFILWHDFNLELTAQCSWIGSVCQAVEMLCKEGLIKGRILHLRDSWVGISRVE